MLVLSRKTGESIQIGDNVIVTVMDSRSNGKVRLGITAPRDVPVFRSELLNGTKEQEKTNGRVHG